MKFYLSSAQDCEPYNDLDTNKLMHGYWQAIERETGVKATFEKDTTFDNWQHIVDNRQHIVVDIPSMKALVQIMKAIGKNLVIEQQLIDGDDKYPTICIYDDYIE